MAFDLAEEERFELPVGFPTAAFKAAALDHSATPPIDEDLAGISDCRARHHGQTHASAQSKLPALATFSGPTRARAPGSCSRPPSLSEWRASTSWVLPTSRIRSPRRARQSADLSGSPGTSR